MKLSKILSVMLLLFFSVICFSKEKELPKMIELGSDTCIPCKMMAPILEDFKTNYSDKFTVEFVDIYKNSAPAKKYKIRVIPTQVFLNSSGSEVFRHEGFFPKEDILKKWKELGFSMETEKSEIKPEIKEIKKENTFKRLEPLSADKRAKDAICFMCDNGIDPKNAVIVKSAKGEVKLCGLHCYYIMYSCLTEDKTDFEEKVFVTDSENNVLIPLLKSSISYIFDDSTGKPVITAKLASAGCCSTSAAEGVCGVQPGCIINSEVLKNKELASRCGFCDRAVYPEDAALVKANGLHTYGCCSHCALGVAARTGLDIEVYQKDALTGEMITVKTNNGKISSLEPKTAVAWFGQKKNKEGKRVSAGCFHQGFFVNEENLKKWVEKNPLETGEMISIEKALADKMALKKEQIQKACKIGECAPK